MLKFADLLSFQNCLFMHKLQQDIQLSKSFFEMIYINNKHNSNTRSANANILDIPQSRTAEYGTFSCKNQWVKYWNHSKKLSGTWSSPNSHRKRPSSCYIYFCDNCDKKYWNYRLLINISIKFLFNTLVWNPFISFGIL